VSWGRCGAIARGSAASGCIPPAVPPADVLALGMVMAWGGGVDGAARGGGREPIPGGLSIANGRGGGMVRDGGRVTAGTEGGLAGATSGVTGAEV
jgi:hypothetical protein